MRGDAIRTGSADGAASYIGPDGPDQTGRCGTDDSLLRIVAHSFEYKPLTAFVYSGKFTEVDDPVRARRPMQ